VRHVGEAALVVMATHLRRLHPQDQLGEHPDAETILSHFRITPADPGDAPPNACRGGS